MTGDKRKKKDKVKQPTDAQKEELRKFNQAKLISKAPPPITPVGDRGPSVVSRINERRNQPSEPIVPITGSELMQRWSLDAAALIYFAQQGLLHPFFPEYFYSDINWLMMQDSKTQISHLSICRYDKDIVEVFEVLYEDYLENFRKKVVSKKDTDAPEKEDTDDIKDYEGFVRSLQVSYVSDTEIRIREDGKEAVSYGLEDLDFKPKADAQYWKVFIEILKSDDHYYYVGKARGKGRAIDKVTDKNRRGLYYISEKLKSFLNKKYGDHLPKQFKLHERVPEQRPGTYRFKFKIKSPNVDKEYFEEKSNKELESLCLELREEYRRLSRKDDKKTRTEKNKIKDSIWAAMGVLSARTGHTVTSSQPENFLNARAEDPSSEEDTELEDES